MGSLDWWVGKVRYPQGKKAVVTVIKDFLSEESGTAKQIVVASAIGNCGDRYFKRLLAALDGYDTSLLVSGRLFKRNRKGQYLHQQGHSSLDAGHDSYGLIIQTDALSHESLKAEVEDTNAGELETKLVEAVPTTSITGKGQIKQRTPHPLDYILHLFSQVCVALPGAISSKILGVSTGTTESDYTTDIDLWGQRKSYMPAGELVPRAKSALRSCVLGNKGAGKVVVIASPEHCTDISTFVTEHLKFAQSGKASLVHAFYLQQESLVGSRL